MNIGALGVVDITDDTPLEDDVFFVDSNVWFWLTYERASLGNSKPLPYQVKDYPEYIDAAFLSESKMYRSGLSLSELSHQIEKVEYDIFCATHSLNMPNKKSFRRNYPIERANVVEQIELAWLQVKQMGIPLESEIINEQVTDLALNRFQNQLIDGYDIFLMEFIKSSGIVNVISDDGDLASVPGIKLFTANRTVIEEAILQGKLIER
ncbi:hypothetical protein [Niallia sp. NCCP-28]|uniref:hypothetical protein n=1 Tax=Niallia sp. NCCP-28 TaxID=2934712 RepID=UPI00208370F1|nr:hypothetical protein [Niallia sp. NCCP-28]GKU81187.1 hypothetical protein NCCP28_05830 [Niallia sp. NCCP-28]